MDMPDKKSAPPRLSKRLYDKLGVAPDASIEAIRAAHKVLENAYRPDGAYVDDVMHQAFMEIAGAAAILTNPKTRKRYDQGYIDERGKPTKAGLANASRNRAVVLAGVLASVCLGGLLILPFLALKKPGVHSQEHEKASTPAPNPASVAAREPVIPAPASARKDADAGFGDGSKEPPPATSAPREADARDYLPPDTVLHSGRDRSGNSSIGAPHPRLSRKDIERHARSPERSQRAPLSRPFDGAVQAREPGPVSQSLRTAHCLACLTDHQAECAKACP